MTAYLLSGRAERDIEDIGRASIARWGWVRTERYLDDLNVAFDMLALHPALGRSADHIRRGYRRFECGSHSIFYLRAPDGVLIMRVLHNRMHPDRHL